MSISMLFTEDIVGVEELSLRVVVEVLRIAEEKENLFTIFLIGTTMQDGGKRKRSDGSKCTMIVFSFYIYF